MKRIFYVLTLLLISFPLLSQSTVIDIENRLAELDAVNAGAAGSVKKHHCMETASNLLLKEYIFPDLEVIEIYEKDVKFNIGIFTRSNFCYANHLQCETILGKYSLDVEIDDFFNREYFLHVRGGYYMKCNKDDSGFDTYWVVIPDYDDVRQLRTGQKITITGNLFSVRYGTIYCVADEISYAGPTVVKCENGHEYPASTTYKFCPECGKPLK